MLDQPAPRSPVRPADEGSAPAATALTPRASRSVPRRLSIPAAVLLVLAAGSVQAAELTIPHSFSSGQPALASEVNANFNAVASAVNDNDARIAQLEATVAALQAQLAALQASNVMALDPYVMVTDIEDPNDGTLYDTVQIVGANLQLINGLGEGVHGANGLGNLIVGHNSLRASGDPRCSVSNWPNEQDCVANGGVWAVDHRNGSHNLVVGNSNSYSSIGGLVAGDRNLISGAFASISGGSRNTASGQAASVSGGELNRASGLQSSISGGSRGLAFGFWTSVSGGSENRAIAPQSTVGGGRSRDATGQFDWTAGSLYELD